MEFPMPKSILFLSFLLIPALSYGSEIAVDLTYAQSPDAWTTVHEVENAKGDIDQIDDILHANYGTYEEIFGRVAVLTSGIKSGLEYPLFDSLYFGVSSDILGYGQVQNPVVPELQADIVLTGELKTGFDGRFDPLGLHTELGAHFGMGTEKRIDAVSTDLIQSIPTQTGRLTYFGFDFQMKRNFEIDRACEINSLGSVTESTFESAISGDQSTYVRWRLKNDLRMKLVPIITDKDDLIIETIAGPQPLPVEILPRTFDYVNQLDPLPELGAMVGAGLAWESQWKKTSNFIARVGFYGGYVGGGVSLATGILRFSVQNYEVEASTAYQTLGQRIWITSLGFVF
jgi:hypothetical protein